MRVGSIVCVLFLGVFACTPKAPDLPPIVVETEHLQIGLSASYQGRLCQGDVQRFEDQLMRAADALDVSIDDPIELYLYEVSELPCPDPGSFGCYYEDDDRIFATTGSWDHELAHAAHARMARKDRTDPFLYEAAAEALEEEAVRFPAAAVPSHEFGSGKARDVATHFVRWIRATHGDEAFRQVLSEGDAVELVESALGASLDVIDENWASDSAWVYVGTNPCPGSPAAPTGDSWLVQEQVSCQSTDVRSFGSETMTQCWTVEVGDPGLYTLDLPQSVEAGLMTQCVLEDIEVEEDLASSADVPLEFENPNAVEFLAGEHVVELVTGTYELCVFVAGLEPVDVSVTLSRGDG